jgi:hypothetical protein
MPPQETDMTTLYPASRLMLSTAHKRKAYRAAHGMTRARLVTLSDGRSKWTVQIGNACTLPTGDRNEAARRALSLRSLLAV